MSQCVKKLLYLLLANYVSYCFKVCGPDDVTLLNPLQAEAKSSQNRIKQFSSIQRFINKIRHLSWWIRLCGWKLCNVRIVHTVFQLSMYIESKEVLLILLSSNPGGGLFIANLSDVRGSL